ncbi:helix-turn-helix domain-containing protein [Leptothoe kymatousa]|uniref:Helix-turn-helix transcriptional regulator n=1 Tax=Leptothoe kymatousa TAU-MAC 1615 TaxID=2364775 RepID=A0ABS5Y2U1_9CYAN|nr:helix-turn-helix transcriptional regulator [Leptothoe kymatousa]MBT9312116.1 helix-turn-helix transcriptional regulator [Leptothoe kymatousa TAU-MAC 1615]
MGKAGKVLKEVLDDYGISQTQLAQELNIGRSNVYRWVNEVRDPNSETVIEIIRVLKKLDQEAAKTFVEKYVLNEL